jgi:tRNA (guanine-N7-)-methyltransferase
MGQLARVLEPGALLHISTDHPGYAEWIAETMGRVSGFMNLHPAAWTSVRPDRPETAYEAEFLAEGRTIAYFDYRRDAAPRSSASPGAPG